MHKIWEAASYVYADEHLDEQQKTSLFCVYIMDGICLLLVLTEHFIQVGQIGIPLPRRLSLSRSLKQVLELHPGQLL